MTLGEPTFKSVPSVFLSSIKDSHGYECPVCDKIMEIVLKNPESGTSDPMAIRGAIAMKCECVGAYEVIDLEYFNPSLPDVLLRLREKIDRGWHDRYGDPQHGMTKKQWYKVMWEFEHGDQVPK